MRHQPQGRIRPRAGAHAIGYVLGDSPSDAFGRGSDLVYGGGPVKVANTHGLARKFVAASSQYASTVAPDGFVSFAEPFVVVMAFIADSVATTTRLLHYGESYSAVTVQLLVIGSRLAFIKRNGNGGSTVNSTDAIEAGKPYVVAFGFDGTAHFMYINGVAQAGPVSTSIANPTTGTTIHLARRSDNTSHFNGQVSMFAHIRGQADAQSLSLNPWQMFATSEEDDELGAAVGGGAGYTLSAEAGMLTLIGSDGPIRATRHFSAGHTALTIGGTEATVRAVRKTSLDLGAVSIAGAATLLRAGRIVRPANGALAIVGAGSAMPVARRWPGTTGSLAVVGGVAYFDYAPEGADTVLMPLSGVFSVTGGAASMSVRRRLSTGCGIFATVPEEAAMRFAARLAAGPGAPEIVGTSTAMRSVWRLHADAMVLTLIGHSLTLRMDSIDLPESRIYSAPAERRTVRANPERRVYRERLH